MLGSEKMSRLRASWISKVPLMLGEAKTQCTQLDKRPKGEKDNL